MIRTNVSEDKRFEKINRFAVSTERIDQWSAECLYTLLDTSALYGHKDLLILTVLRMRIEYTVRAKCIIYARLYFHGCFQFKILKTCGWSLSKDSSWNARIIDLESKTK